MSDKKSKLVIQCFGIVQGVGFRPFVYQLAIRHDLTGWVKNVTSHVEIVISGSDSSLEAFHGELIKNLPRGAELDEVKVTREAYEQFDDFSIAESLKDNGVSSVILPDAAICPECLEETFDPKNRRYLYPFTTCTLCGPRYSLSEKMPFDRENLTISSFIQCKECLGEYRDPLNRRFHSQTNSCPSCGPEMRLYTRNKIEAARGHKALSRLCKKIKEGHVVAVKGTSGFHLIVRADDPVAVGQLRTKKRRSAKPFAIMATSLNWVTEHFNVSPKERKLLTSSVAPIVLLKPKAQLRGICLDVAPGLKEHGVMLPATALHQIISTTLNVPLVATSGNISDEPICYENHRAFELPAEYFFTHNLELKRGLDDSVFRVVAERPLPIRRCKGLVPKPIKGFNHSMSTLATGAHLKNTLAISSEKGIFISPPHGDLELKEALDSFDEDIENLPRYFQVETKSIACDSHPDYYSSIKAGQLSTNSSKVQHHLAHVFSCAVDNQLQPPFLGVAWDGAGFGLDGTTWGGEFFAVDNFNEVKRVASLRTFPLLGGDKAAKEPRRVALALLLETFGEEAWQLNWTRSMYDDQEMDFWKSYWDLNRYENLTSSMGRLFDGVSSLLNVSHINRYEGEAAIRLEAAASSANKDYFEVQIEGNDFVRLDWRPWVRKMVESSVEREFKSSSEHQAHISSISSQFHNSLAQTIAAVAKRFGYERAVLSGGVFQNSYLANRCIEVLGSENCFTHKNIPPNDSGLCVGQILAAESKTRLICV